jgi:hypothetical protein
VELVDYSTIIPGYIMQNILSLFLISPGNGVDVSLNNNILGSLFKKNNVFQFFSNIHHSFV